MISRALQRDNFLRWALAVLFSSGLLFLAPTIAAAAINEQIPFQGTLKTSAGVAVTDGDYDMVFRLYDAASGGTLLWTGTHSAGNGNEVTVTDGIFRVMLGSGTGNSISGVNFNSADLYLGITIESDSEMTPRQRLGATPYAFNADTVDGFHASDFLSTTTTDVSFENATITNAVATNFTLSGTLTDSLSSVGTSGYVLQTTGAGVRWVATSSLGISGGGANPFGADINANELASEDFGDFTCNGTICTLDASYLTTVDISSDTNLSVSATGLELSGDALVLSAGYSIPLTASTTAWNDFLTSGLSTTTGDWVGTFDGQEGSYYLSRANHTGTQATSTITGIFADASVTDALTISGSGSVADGALSANVSLLGATIDLASEITGTLASTSIEDAYLRNTGDTATGDYIFDTDTFVIDATNDRVGIGTSSPTATLTVQNITPSEDLMYLYQGNSGATASPNANNLIIEGGTTVGMSLLAPDANDIRIDFGSASDSTGANILWNHDSALMEIGTTLAGGGSALMFKTGNNAERMRIDASGNVGIGTTSPAGILDLTQAGASASLYLRAQTAPTTYSRLYADQDGVMILDADPTASGGNRSLRFRVGSTERMRIDASGNVGIGTTSPNELLTLSASGGNTVLELLNEDSNSDWELVARSVDTHLGLNSDLVGGVEFIFTASSTMAIGQDTTPDASLEVLQSNSLPYFMLSSAAGNDGDTFIVDNSGNVGIGTTTPSTGKLVVAAGSNANALTLENNLVNKYWSLYNFTNGSATDLRFYEQDTSVNALTLQAGGNVGIGTTTPERILHVANGTLPALRLDNSDTTIVDTQTLGILEFYSRDASVDGVGVGASVEAVAENAGSWYGLAFSTRDASNGTAERLRIDHEGNVGIGTSSPSAALDVAGTAEVGYLVLNDEFTNSGIHTGQTDGVLSLAGGANGINDGANIGLYGPDHAQAGQFILRTGTRNTYQMSSTSDLHRWFRPTTGDELMRLNSTGLGIGTTNPDSVLTVMSADPALTPDANADELSIQGTGNTGMSIFAGVDDTASIYFGEQAFGTGRSRIVHDGSDESLALYTAATQRLTINSSGNVGIGTTTPTTKLHVYEGADTSARLLLEATQGTRDARLELATANGNWWLYDNGEATSAFSIRDNEDGRDVFTIEENSLADSLYITATGVGIGTSSPTKQLHVNGDVYVENADDFDYLFDTNSLVTATFNNENTGASAGLRQLMRSSGSGDAYTIYQRTLGGTENWSVGIASGSNNSFAIDNGSSLATPELVIDQTGNVGIGTTSPSEILHIYKSGGNANLARFENPNISSTGAADIAVIASSTSAQLKVYNDTYGAGGGVLSDTVYLTQTAGAGGLMLGTETAAPIRFVTNGFANERMRIDSTGKVGIGTSTPAHYLNVYGNDTDTLARFDNFQSAGSDIGIAVYAHASGTNVSNAAFYGEAYGSTDDYGIYLTGEDYNHFSGSVGIGEIVPSEKLHVSITASTGNILRLEDGDSTCNLDASGSGPSCGSDRTLKKDIEVIEGELAKVLLLEPSYWKWKTDSDASAPKSGFIAQEVELVLPELVRESTWIDGTEKKFLNIGGMMPYVVGAIKEMWEVVTGNQEKIDDLEDRIEQLEAELGVEATEDEEDEDEETETEEEEEDEGSSGGGTGGTNDEEEDDGDTATNSDETASTTDETVDGTDEEEGEDEATASSTDPVGDTTDEDMASEEEAASEDEGTTEEETTEESGTEDEAVVEEESETEVVEEETETEEEAPAEEGGEGTEA